jgi:hypothetical protein
VSISTIQHWFCLSGIHGQEDLFAGFGGRIEGGDFASQVQGYTPVEVHEVTSKSILPIFIVRKINTLNASQSIKI